MKGIKKSALIAVFFLVSGASFFFGCGYTTRGFLNPKYSSIYIKPVVNKVTVTGEIQEYSKFRNVPVLLENSLTQSLIARFNLEGNLKVVSQEEADLVLECEINDFVRETLRYDDQDNVEEYRLKLYYHYKVHDRDQNIVNDKTLIADAEYALTGSAARSEEAALTELLDDAARRVSEDIIEVW